MSKFFVITGLLLAATIASAAEKYRVNYLECELSNGVTLETQKRSAQGLVVESKLGTYTKPFTVTVGVVGYESPTYLHLNDENGEALYMLALQLAPTKSKLQTVEGSLLQVNALLPSWPVWLATADCKVQVVEN
ncbi:MAG: hypothetical protein ACAH59_01080 [Pseudobdellovibrionaceae bacterium]